MSVVKIGDRKNITGSIPSVTTFGILWVFRSHAPTNPSTPAHSPLPIDARVKSRMKFDIIVVAMQKISPDPRENPNGFWI
tara:strand:- start:609 stop:848 length:240 start_codon:yes stop_codon:yes gene_type:complete